MRRQTIVYWVVSCGILSAWALAYGLWGRAVQIDKYGVSERPPRIYPDYSSMVIPPNIAPLDFMIQENGSYYFVRIYSAKGEAIEVFSRSRKIAIPVDSWHRILDKNRGGEVHFDVFVRTDKREWVRFGTITNKIANEIIDGYLFYRKMHPTYFLMSRHIGIYQRNLENFDESAVLDRGCANCHTFYKNRTDKALIGVRFEDYEGGTLLIENGTVKKIGVKFGYTAWHPSGRLAVYTLNTLPLFFHTARKEARDIVDMYSMLSYFVIDSNEVRTSPNISKKERLENWPVWSVDGRYLYFCSAPLLWADLTKTPPDNYDKTKYDLVRISYDVNNDKWGEVETVISAKNTGLSIAMPKMSPDGCICRTNICWSCCAGVFMRNFSRTPGQCWCPL